MKAFKTWIVYALAVVWFGTSFGARAADPVPKAPPEPPRYTFSWPLDGSALKPRGGSTRGAPVMLDQELSTAWKALQAPGLTPQERDRRAILAMAGTYRVTFDFLEVAAYAATGKPLGPYQSWGTEKVYVDKDEAGFVSLVHILEMRLLDKDGKVSDPFVTKHWRQDWRYEPDVIVEYKGGDRWERRPVADAERQGAWMQTVYQVDESPRYASIGRWQHSASLSTWLSADTWRPLPRREWSVRDDYQVLLGTNRHTIGPTGWTQEENNLKTVLTAQRSIDTSRPYVAREYGMARYERLRDADFAAADRYYDRTRSFWDQVRDAWSAAFEQQGTITLRGPVDKLGMFMPLFERADQIEEKGVVAGDDDGKLIREALARMRITR
jgi:hypothetical protein